MYRGGPPCTEEARRVQRRPAVYSGGPPCTEEAFGVTEEAFGVTEESFCVTEEAFCVTEEAFGVTEEACVTEEAHRVQSLLKVAIHGGGGATRPDLGRAVQFEGHWIARPNPGRQRAGGAAGAGTE